MGITDKKYKPEILTCDPSKDEEMIKNYPHMEEEMPPIVYYSLKQPPILN